jgi:hypothetical protein
MPQVLLIHQGVNEEGQNADHPVLEQANREQIGEVEPEFEVVIAVHELHDDSGGHGCQHQNDLYQQQSCQFRAEEHPSLNRQRVHNLVEAGISLPPYQLTGIESDNRQGEDEQTAGGPLKHLVSDGVGVAGERIVDLIRDQNREQASRQEQDQKKDILDSLRELNSGQGKKLPPRGAGRENWMCNGQGSSRGNRYVFIRIRRHPLFPGTLYRIGQRKLCVGDGQDDPAQPQP